jgi:hypothetical protein
MGIGLTGSGVLEYGADMNDMNATGTTECVQRCAGGCRHFCSPMPKGEKPPHGEVKDAKPRMPNTSQVGRQPRNHPMGHTSQTRRVRVWGRYERQHIYNET